MVLKRIPHQPQQHFAVPELFGAIRGVGRLGAWALPSVTITWASILIFVCLSFFQLGRETWRYFFRLPQPPNPFSPLGLAMGGFLLALVIVAFVWRRPGPYLPRVWAWFVLGCNFAVLTVACALQWIPSHVPPFLHAPWPLNGVCVAATAAALALIPRLIRTHPLRRRVQQAGPVSLAAILVISVIPIVVFIAAQIDAERTTLLQMAANLDAAADRLRRAARYNYAQVADRVSRRQADEAMAGLRASPDALALPDAARWEAVRILEQAGELEAGRVERATRGLIEGLNSVLTNKQIPRLRTGRYILAGDPLQYVSNDGSGPNLGGSPRFAVPADLASAYYSNAARWVAHAAALGVGPVGSYYSQTVDGPLAQRLEAFSTRPETFWWAQLLRDAGTPSLDIASVLELPLRVGGRPAAGADGDIASTSAAQLDRWSSATWGSWGRFDRGLSESWPTCRRAGYRIRNQTLVPATDDLLSERERTSGEPYYAAVRFDAEGVMQCFLYQAPGAFGGSPIVIEMRLDYAVRDREQRFLKPCKSDDCKPSMYMPADTQPATVQLLVDVPDRAEAGFAATVVRSVQQAAERTGSAVPALSPGVIEQAPGHKAVQIKIK